MANEQLNNALKQAQTDEVKTLKQLYDIQAKNAPSNVFLPFIKDPEKNAYNINLNTRVINGPAALSVRRDHKAQVVYFKVDRYFDYMDLTNTVCVIQYLTPKEKIPRVYIVPYYDTTTCVGEDKILFPWVVGGMATAEPGIIEYSIRFYKVERNGDNIQLLYNLSTLPTKTKILDSLNSDGEIMNAEYDSYIGSQWEDLVQQALSLQTYWTIL